MKSTSAGSEAHTDADARTSGYVDPTTRRVDTVTPFDSPTNFHGASACAAPASDATAPPLNATAHATAQVLHHRLRRISRSVHDFDVGISASRAPSSSIVPSSHAQSLAY